MMTYYQHHTSINPYIPTTTLLSFLGEPSGECSECSGPLELQLLGDTHLSLMNHPGNALNVQDRWNFSSTSTPG